MSYKHEEKYRKTVAGVVYQKKEVLMIQKPDWDWWDFPQGGVDAGESLEVAARREMREELGTDRFGEPTNTHITQRRAFSHESLEHYPHKNFSGKDITYLLIEFLGDRADIKLGGDLKDGKHHWFVRREVPDYIYHEELEQTLQILRILRGFGLV
jgi:8-oxo-dGTP pyrophosphatase MutT (NUDIX family)